MGDYCTKRHPGQTPRGTCSDGPAVQSNTTLGLLEGQSHSAKRTTEMWERPRVPPLSPTTAPLPQITSHGRNTSWKTYRVALLRGHQKTKQTIRTLASWPHWWKEKHKQLEESVESETENYSKARTIFKRLEFKNLIGVMITNGFIIAEGIMHDVQHPMGKSKIKLE